jgi:hypothetical protein
MEKTTNILVAEVYRIAYITTKELTSLDDKFDITNLFLFAILYKDKNILAKLLYSPKPKEAIQELNETVLEPHGVTFDLDLDDPDIKRAFESTKVKVIYRFDDDLFYKGLFEGDVYAKMMIDTMLEMFSGSLIQAYNTEEIIKLMTNERQKPALEVTKMQDREGQTIKKGDVLESFTFSALTLVRFNGEDFEPVVGFGNIYVSNHCFIADNWKILTSEKRAEYQKRFKILIP